jgi:uncharacterized protein (TIGR03084 family)
VDEITAALAAQDEELAGLLTGRSDDDWHRPSPCEGWDVADVVLHVAQTNELAIASLEGAFPAMAERLAGDETRPGNVDDAADLMVEQERGATAGEIFDRWQRTANRFLELADATDLSQHVTWVAGELSARTLVTTRLSETWIHTNDVADALGVPLAPTERQRHIARLAWRTLPYAFARSGKELTGPVAFDLRGPSGDSWEFTPDDPALTTVTGSGAELCLVAARRLEPSATRLRAVGPDAEHVLALVRTYA